MKVYLAVHYSGEGWVLNEYSTAEEALIAAKKGETYGNEWKILKELDIFVSLA